MGRQETGFYKHIRNWTDRYNIKFIDLGIITTMEILRTLPILCLAIGVELKGHGNSRILNGQDSNVLPYQVFLDFHGSMCGGSLIKPDWVLTAEHCLSGNPVTVRAGISNLKEKGEKRVVPVVSIFKHDYTDLALLKIDPPFEESDKIKPIQINDVHEDLNGKEVLISGWGKTTTSTSASPQLQAVNLTVNSKFKSVEYKDEMISMVSSEGKGSCLGDSGGPAVLEGKDDLLVGVSSSVCGLNSNKKCIKRTRETVCGKDANNGKQWPYMLSNYVDVFKHADWIKEKTNKINGLG